MNVFQPSIGFELGQAQLGLSSVGMYTPNNMLGAFNYPRYDSLGVRRPTVADNLASPIGLGAIATQKGSVALGSYSKATYFGATAVGYYAQGVQTSVVAVGDQAKAKAYRSIAIGRMANATGINSIAMGVLAYASASSGIAIGNAAKASAASAIAIGINVSSTAQSTIVIGASSSGSGATSVVIGQGAQTNAANTVVIGNNASITNSLRTKSVVIGESAIGFQNGVSVGAEANASASSGIAVGYQSVGAQNSVAIGTQATCAGFTPSIAVGYLATITANNQMVVGSASGSITSFYFGQGVTSATAPAIDFNASGGSGSNIAGGDFTIAGGKGTGTGVGGMVLLKTATPGSSGSSLNSLTTGAKLDYYQVFGLSSFKRVSTQFDKTDTTLADITGLSVTLRAGITYRFVIRLHVSPSAAGGYKFGFGGTATATTFRAQRILLDNSAIAMTYCGTVSSLSDVLSGGGNTSYFHEVCGVIVVNAAGTFTVTFAQNAASGTSSILIGSTLEVIETL